MSNQSMAVFLKWVKDTHPQVFAAAVRKAKAKTFLGGLGDDLVSDVSVDPNAITVDPSVSAAVDQASTDSSTADAWSGFFSALSSAVSNVAPSIVQTKAQLATIQANQARAAAGYSANVTPSSLLTGMGLSGGSSSMILLVGGLGLLALLMGRRSRR